MAQSTEPDIRMTRQRRVILEVLQRSSGHLTGDEIYRRARRRLPHISLGTVYRNLELLSEAGAIGRVEMAGMARHYDVTVAPHYHIRCLHCGKVEDLPLASLAALERQAQAATGYQVVAHHLELAGLCPDCQKRRHGAAYRARGGKHTSGAAAPQERSRHKRS
jgi:Fur family ferric uptake transcriptional regulator